MRVIIFLKNVQLTLPVIYLLLFEAKSVFFSAGFDVYMMFKLLMEMPMKRR
jgi:hypothetical protein